MLNEVDCGRCTAVRREINSSSNGQVSFGDCIVMFLANWTRVLVLLVVWTVVAFLLLSPFRCISNTDDAVAAEVQKRIKQVSSQLETLRQQHSSLISRIRKSPGFMNLKNINGSLIDLDQGPMKEYENLRRRIYSNTKELWLYVNHELRKVMTGERKLDYIEIILDQVADRKRSLLSDQDKLVDMDGYQDWRRMEAANVSDLVQRRLHYLQNPSDCKEARKLVCDIHTGCGFGCELHHLVFCLIIAYATERTLILDSKYWLYKTEGWEYVFHPLSETCTSTYFDENMQMWPVSYEAKVVFLPIIDTIPMKPKFVPPVIPKDLAHRIARFNGDPVSWWIGQMIKYILKPRPSMQKIINATIAKIDFKSPIVGIHVRRTDKVGSEAILHHIYEYMNHVKDFYYQLEMTQTVDVKRVYVATDDASILAEARKIYPEFKFVGDPSFAEAAATHRYSPQSLTGVLVDLELLSSCDYLVCTMSSTFGRVAYELMQTKRTDASTSFFSLDANFFFFGQITRLRVAVMTNADTGDGIALGVNDVIDINGKRGWSGYSHIGTNTRTNLMGYFPWYKTVERLSLYPFPEYKQVPIRSNDTRRTDT